ncbi:AAA family ATPase [Dyadobacter sp.]|uniref:AAA family ATPase n=1 Tax=Dyadobacter sp. TaxID=1914288 RepID=UPI003F716AC4
MLIRFIAENFLSFNERTEFNMLTGDLRRLPDHVYRSNKIDILRSAVIYGANGAGKSNLINAIKILSEIVSDGVLSISSDDTCFRLSDQGDRPSMLEIHFITEGVAYSYSLAFIKDLIIRESLNLLNFGKKEDSLIFDRTINKQGKVNIKLAPKYLKTRKDKLLIQIYEEDVLDPEMTFITLVKEKKYQEITSAYNWLESGLLIIFPGMQYGGLVSNFINDEEFKVFTNEIISGFDTGVDQIDIQTIDFEAFFGEDNALEKEKVLRSIKTGETERVGDNRNALAMMENGKPVVKKAVSYHSSSAGTKVKFELFEESDGTLRLLDFIPFLYMLEKYPVTVIVDEIDQSIHPVMLKELVTKIQNNPKKVGQLIFTTHEANLLDTDLFRQDEIWFVEKNKTGASHFYQLLEFDTRSDLDIRKGYLSGKFGAIPFLGNIKDLHWASGNN